MTRRRYKTGTVRQLPSGAWQARRRLVEGGPLVPAPFTFLTEVDASNWLRDEASVTPTNTVASIADLTDAVRRVEADVKAIRRLLEAESPGVSGSATSSEP